MTRRGALTHTVALIAALGLSAALGGGQGQVPAARGASATVTLSIVGTNDLHGGVLPSTGRGGLALLGGYVNNLRAARARDGGAVLLIDAGDMWQGTLESNLDEGATVVAAYNALGYTAAAVGNHELDFGPQGPAATPRHARDDPRGALKARATEARFPLLAANLIDTATGRPVAWPNVQPSVIVDVAEVKVGIVGVMTLEALAATIAANGHGLRVASLPESIATEARKLRADGATVIVVTAHAGGRCTRFDDPADLSSCDASSEIIAVARALPQRLVDVIVAGHVHAGMAVEVEGIAITSAFADGRAFGRVDLAVDRQTRSVRTRKVFAPRDLVAAEYEGTRVTPDPRITRVLAPAVERAAARKAAPLGVLLDTPIRRAGAESPLGNLVTDAMRASVAGAHVALNNTVGGLRADLPRGPLTYGSIYEMCPFDNRLISIRLTGAQLKRVFSSALQRGRSPIGISGIRVVAQCAGSSLAVTVFHQSGAPVRDDETLVVATSDYLATGGVGMLTPIMPAGGFAIPDDAPEIREAIADHLRRRGGRLREDQLVDRIQPRWAYPGPFPVSCPR